MLIIQYQAKDASAKADVWWTTCKSTDTRFVLKSQADLWFRWFIYSAPCLMRVLFNKFQPRTIDAYTDQSMSHCRCHWTNWQDTKEHFLLSEQNKLKIHLPFFIWDWLSMRKGLLGVTSTGCTHRVIISHHIASSTASTKKRTSNKNRSKPSVLQHTQQDIFLAYWFNTYFLHVLGSCFPLWGTQGNNMSQPSMKRSGEQANQ